MCRCVVYSVRINTVYPDSILMIICSLFGQPAVESVVPLTCAMIWTSGDKSGPRQFIWSAITHQSRWISQFQKYMSLIFPALYSKMFIKWWPSWCLLHSRANGAQLWWEWTDLNPTITTEWNETVSPESYGPELNWAIFCLKLTPHTTYICLPFGYFSAHS